MKTRISIATLIVLSCAIFANAQTVEKTALTLDGAKKVIAGAVAYAKKNNAPGGAIAVVDDGGNLVALERLDGTFAAAAKISIGKARTAALFKKATKAFEDNIKNGRTSLLALPDDYFTPLQGGVPITINGQIVGGIGVSGAASAQQDEEIAIAGANILAETKINSSLSAGTVLLEESGRLMAHTSRQRSIWPQSTVLGQSKANGVTATRRLLKPTFVDPDQTSNRPARRSKLMTTRHTPVAQTSTIRSGRSLVQQLWMNGEATAG
jgi:glc operon protein GlcG